MRKNQTEEMKIYRRKQNMIYVRQRCGLAENVMEDLNKDDEEEWKRLWETENGENGYCMRSKYVKWEIVNLTVEVEPILQISCKMSLNLGRFWCDQLISNTTFFSKTSSHTLLHSLTTAHPFESRKYTYQIIWISFSHFSLPLKRINSFW